MVNFLKFIADMVHLISILILLIKVRQTRNCIGTYYFLHVTTIGVSAKTQELYAIVFCLRYMDLFLYMVSWYNTLMKLAFICTTLYTLYLVKWKRPYSSVWFCCMCSIHVRRMNLRRITLSITSTYCQLLEYLHYLYTTAGCRSNSPGAIVFGWKHLPFYLNCTCSKDKEK